MPELEFAGRVRQCVLALDPGWDPKVLHIDIAPQVSEWRKGRVTDLEEPGHVLTVEPWPDSSVHPVLGLRQPSPAAHDTWQVLRISTLRQFPLVFSK